MKYIFRFSTATLILILGIAGYPVMSACNHIAPLDEAAKIKLWPKFKAPKPTLIKDVTIVDTKNGKLLKNMDVLLSDGKIKMIAPTGELTAPQHTQIIQASGKYIIPGLINMHMHVIDYPNPTENLAMMLTNGITGFRQMSGSAELLKLRKQHKLNMLDDQPAMLGMPGSVLTPVNTHSVKAARKNVQEQLAQGADFIKIGMLPSATFYATLAEGKRLGIPVLGHVTANDKMQEASESGFKSVEHLGLNYGGLTACSTEEASLISQAPKIPAILSYLPTFLEALSMKLLQSTLINPAVGTAEEEYLRISRIVATFDESKARQNAKLYLANGTWQCPTISHLRQYQLAFLPEIKNESGYKYDESKKEHTHQKITGKFEKELTPERKQILINAYSLQLKLVKIYDEMGLKLLAGTDDQNGNQLQLEFEEFAKAGLSPLHILQTATINPAEFLGRRSDMGSVEVGKIADLVILDSNPLKDIKNVRHINAVVRNGFYHDKEELTSLKENALKIKSK